MTAKLRVVVPVALLVVAAAASPSRAQSAGNNPWAQPAPPPTAPAAPTPTTPPPPSPPPSPPAPPPAPAGAVKPDAIVLKDGTRIEGRVREQVRGQYAVIEVTNGPVRTITWDKIDEVIVWSTPGAATAPVAPPPPPQQQPPVDAGALGDGADDGTTGRALHIGHKKNQKKVRRVSTTIGFTANKDGAGISRTVKCSTNGDPTCKETEALTVGREGPKATYSAETDCSKKPGTDECKETKAIGVSGAGIGASFTKEELVAVDEEHRPSGSVNFSLTGLVGGGVGTGMESGIGVFITNLDMNLKMLTGGKFPKKTGGNWVGLALEPTLGFVFEAINIPAMNIDGFETSPSSSTSAGFRVGASAGLQIMHFNKMNESLKQRGIGVFLGAFVGYQETSTSDGMGGMTTSGNSSIGPQLEIVFPSFNPGTAKYSSSSLNFMILPTGDFVFISVGFADTF